MLEKFNDLQKEIKSFTESKGKLVPEFEDEKWLTDLVLSVDLTTHLNELNLHLWDEN